MNKLITILLSILLCISCCTTTQIPVETIINYKDSTLIHMVDSIRYIPKERIVDVVPVYDSLTLETNMAKTKAWVDTTTHTLKGSLENKKGITEKIKYKEKIVYRDSIIKQEVPVEVIKEVVKTKAPFYQPILWLFALLSISYIGWKILKKYLLKVV